MNNSIDHPHVGESVWSELKYPKPDMPWHELDLSDGNICFELAMIEFHDAMGIPVNNHPKQLDRERLKRHFKIIHEEIAELTEALLEENPAEHALKEFADVLYTVYSLSVETGFWPYVEEAFYRVHESNMTKADPETGKVVYREDGKVLKGPYYIPPNFDNMNVKYS